MKPKTSTTSGPPDGEYGLFVMMEGAAEFVLRDDTGSGDLRYEARPGSAVFVTGQQRSHILRMAGNGTAVALRITPEWFRRLALGDAPAAFGASPPLSPDETVHRLVDTMCNEVSRQRDDRPGIRRSAFDGAAELRDTTCPARE